MKTYPGAFTRYMTEMDARRQDERYAILYEWVSADIAAWIEAGGGP